MIGALLPEGVSVAHTRVLGRTSDLLAVEAAEVAGAGARRQSEFAAGRRCAREALAGLGVPRGAIMRGARREPLWPASIVGSITHCAGYCAAAVARVELLPTLGIDAEEHAELPPKVLEAIATPRERAWVAEQVQSDVCWDRALFSAKESVLKAWYPLSGALARWRDIEITFAPTAERFEAQVRARDPVQPGVTHTFAGRMLVADGLVLTSAIAD